MRSNRLFVLILLGFLASCHLLENGTEETNESSLARVGDERLYYSEIKNIVKQAPNEVDSAEVVENYVNDWVKRKLMLLKARNYLPESKLNIEKQVKDYEESLTLYLYEKELVLQKLDTTVTEEEARQYFQEHEDDFELSEDAVQFFYVKMAKGAPKLDSLEEWIRSDDEIIKEKLADHCFQYAEDFSIYDSIWYERSLILEKIPAEPNYLNTLCRDKSTGTVEDSSFIYFLKVNDFKEKGRLAPFNFVFEDISKIILNKRKLDLVKFTYNKAYQDALRDNSFEIY